MNVPIINHPDYVAQIGDDHRFPIKKFGELIKNLKKKNIATDHNIFKPTEVSKLTLLNVHDETYIIKLIIYLYARRNKKIRFSISK